MDETYSKINNICLVILSGFALAGALIYAKAALIPFVLAFFIYALLSPLVNWFQTKWKLVRIASVLLTIGLFLAGTLVLLVFVSKSMANFLASAEAYQDKIIKFLTWASSVATRWGIQIENASIENTLRNLPLFAMASSVTGNVFSFLGKATLVMIFVLFLIVGKGTGMGTHPLLQEIQGKISRYITIKVSTSVFTGMLVWLTLAIFKVELAFMFGILAILLNLIPTLGSIFATILPLPVLLLQYDFGWQFYTVLLITGFIQFSVGNVLEPKLMGKGLDLHPVTVLLFLIFWGVAWGLPGMFLAVPITASMKIILSRIETTKPLADILAGRAPFGVG